MPYDAELLRAVAPHNSGNRGVSQNAIINAVGPVLSATLADYGITTDLLVAHFVAQTCQEWLDREYQAYDVQYRWLRDSSPNVRSFSIQMAKLNHTALVVRCPSTGVGQAATMGDSPLDAAPH